MVRFYFEKLVRDKIVQSSEDDPKVLAVSWHELNGIDYRRELVKKVLEEVAEIPVSDDNPEKVLEELADLQEVVDALRNAAGFTEEQVRAAAAEKVAKKGSFVQRHYIDYVDLAPDSEWIEIFRQQPDKYREVAEE